ncbi:multidrug effflux MFS transporter [Emcibacter sp. SYSU 3D8]|uniref:multidrug effflux MFS transporter n=1 Tax=Emcibacter sp. SYSU 3D8 TaxID=3133969 RepID=UPI0031FE5E48
MSTDTITAARRPTPGVRLTLMLGSLTAFGPMAIDMYLPAMPAIAADLQTDPASAQQTMSVFLIGMALGQLLYGPISDRVGRRPPLMVGIGVFIVMSIGCAFAQTIGSLIVMRFLQALGACVGQVLARAVVTDVYDRREAPRMFSLLMLVMGLAPILAPIGGGWVLAVASWQAIFLVLALFGVLVGALVLFRLPESRSDIVAAHARTESPFRGITAVARNRHIVGYSIAGGLGTASMFTYITCVPDLLIEHYGIPPEHFGWFFGINAAGLIAGSQINRHLLKRHSSHDLLKIALAIGLGLTLILLASALTGIGGLPGLLIPLFLVITCMGFVLPNGGASAMVIDLKRAGSTSAFTGSMAFALGAGGSALAGLLYDGSPMPMAMVMTAALATGVLVLKFVVGKPPVLLAD